MCWNSEVSLLFAGMHGVTYLVVNKYRTKYHVFFKRFLLFYMIMELLQSIQWYIGVADINTNFCTKLNTLFTTIAYTLIWLQPVLFASFTRKKFINYYCLMTFFIAMINLNIGFFSPATEMSFLKNNGQTNYGFPTCTYRGSYGHLLWKFQINTLSYQPTHYIYYSIILLMILIEYKKGLKYTIGFGWIFSLITSIMINGVNNELPSFWCLLSVFADIPILIYTLHKTFNNT